MPRTAMMPMPEPDRRSMKGSDGCGSVGFGRVRHRTRSASEQKRIDGQPMATMYSVDEIREAVHLVMTRLVFGVIAKERVLEVTARLASYAFEWLDSRKDGAVVARSRELLAAIGCGRGENARLDALRDSIESHVSAISRMIEAGVDLPDPMEGHGRASKRPVRSEIVTLRLTPEELRKIKETAEIRSKKVSSLLRDIAVHIGQSPVETDGKSDFQLWVEEHR